MSSLSSHFTMVIICVVDEWSGSLNLNEPMDHRPLAHIHYELTLDPDFILNFALEKSYLLCPLLPRLLLLSYISDFLSSV